MEKYYSVLSDPAKLYICLSFILFGILFFGRLLFRKKKKETPEGSGPFWEEVDHLADEDGPFSGINTETTIMPFQNNKQSDFHEELGIAIPKD